MTSRDRHRREMGLITGYLRELRLEARAAADGVAVRAQRSPAARRSARRSRPARREEHWLKHTA